MHKNKKSNLILVADEFGLDSNNEYLPIFPKISKINRKRFNYNDNKNLHLKSRKYCMNIAEILENFCYENILNELKPSLKNIFYPMSYMFINSYLEIFFRVKATLIKNRNQQILIPNCFNVPDIFSFNQLQDYIISDWRFNQILVSRIAKSLKVSSFLDMKNIKHINSEITENYKNYTSHPIVANKIEEFIQKILNRVSIFFRKFNFRKKNVLLSFGFAHADYYLGLNNFFGPFGIFKNCKNNLSENKIVDQDLRNLIKKKTQKNVSKEINIFLKKDFSEFLSSEDIDICSQDLTETLFEIIPVNYFENLEINLNLAHEDLKGKKGMIGTDINVDKGYIYSCLAKHLKLKTIAVQHGGHCGYLDCKNNSNEFYYYMSDYLITWGWNKFDELMSPCQAIPLPSIRLAQFCKNKYFQYNNIPKKEIEKKVLFFSFTIFRFSSFSNNLAISDYLPSIISDRIKMVEAFKLKKIKIFYKTEKRSIKLFNSYYPILKKKGGKYFELLDLFSRGISDGLIKKYPIIIFDEIGSGALESLAKGIPIMIYWKKIHCREALYAKNDLKKLKDCRVLFDDFEKLTNELNLFFKNPHKWMNCKKRKENIKFFCSKYGLTDQKWSKIWKKNLRNLIS